MEEITIVIKALAEIGVPKETTLEIMHEIVFNASKYAGNKEAIDSMFREKLDIDSYIALNSYVKIN